MVTSAISQINKHVNSTHWALLKTFSSIIYSISSRKFACLWKHLSNVWLLLVIYTLNSSCIQLIWRLETSFPRYWWAQEISFLWICSLYILMHRNHMKTLIWTTTWTCDTQALIIDMPLLWWSVAFTLLWSLMIDFLPCFDQFFDFIWICLNLFLFINTLVCKELVLCFAVCCTAIDCTWLYQVLWSIEFWTSIDRYLCSCIVWCWLNPSTCFWVIRIHFKSLVIIVISRVSCMMDDCRILTDKSSWIVKTFEPVFGSIWYSVSSCWLWLIDMLQLWILCYQLLYCLWSIIDWWSLLIETSLNKVSLSMIKALCLHSRIWISWSNILRVVESISRRLRNNLIHTNIEILSLLKSWMILSISLWCCSRYKIMPSSSLGILIVLVFIKISLLWWLFL